MPLMQKPVGLIRLDAVPASAPRYARTFTEYVWGPRASVHVRLDAAGLEPGDLAGLALSNSGFGWIGVERSGTGHTLAQFDERTGVTTRIPLVTPRVWLRTDCDVTNGTGRFSHSADGARYAAIGSPHLLGDDPTTVQSIRCALFACRVGPGSGGGHADFDAFLVTWPQDGSGTRPAGEARATRPPGLSSRGRRPRGR